MMNLVVLIGFGIFTYLCFGVYPSPAMIATWGVTGLLLMLNWMGVVPSIVLYLMFMLMIVMMMLTGVWTESR